MNENKKIAIIGGDTRQVYLARKFSDAEYETAVWGLSAEENIGGAVRCADWRDAVRGSSAVILPLPSILQGNINTPLSPASILPGEELIDFLPEKIPVMGGLLPEDFIRSAERKNIPVFDYYEDEGLKMKNALATAEGAVFTAIGSYPYTIKNSRCVIVGCGRIGKELLRLLLAMGASVTVAARRPEVLKWAEEQGACVISTLTDEIEKIPKNSIVFNTVPEHIFTEKALLALAGCSLYMELASSPGGINPKDALNYNINYVRALSLPGKLSPGSAADYIYDCVKDFLLRRG